MIKNIRAVNYSVYASIVLEIPAKVINERKVTVTIEPTRGQKKHGCSFKVSCRTLLLLNLVHYVDTKAHKVKGCCFQCFSNKNFFFANEQMRVLLITVNKKNTERFAHGFSTCPQLLKQSVFDKSKPILKQFVSKAEWNFFCEFHIFLSFNFFS